MQIKKVVILGANGTMGKNIAGIFASFGAATVYLISRSIEKSQKAVADACGSVRAESIKQRLVADDYTRLEEYVIDADLIFEACAEDRTIKKEIHSKVAGILAKHQRKEKMICTGTSGLSITEIAEYYDPFYRQCVIGMHFFNPPYQMVLCEMIPTVYTNLEKFNEIIMYCKNILHRTTVVVKDSPAFLANRIGFYFINRALQLAEEYKYSGGIDYIDAIFGPYTGRTMAPMITANFVGLDVLKAIVDNLYKSTNDIVHSSFLLPNFVNRLVERKYLGKKTGGGLYKTVKNEDNIKTHQVYDIQYDDYRNVNQYTFSFSLQMVDCIKNGDYKKAFSILEDNHSMEAEFCLQELIKYILYSLNASLELGESIHSADDVMAAGFNWCPPLAMIDVLGGKEKFVQLCEERTNIKKSMGDSRNKLYDKIEKSQYDFRRFIKAKL